MSGLLTLGHGPLDRAALAAVLRGAAVDLVVDVRRFPGSRSNPDVRRQALEEWLPECGMTYRWEARLGGRRHRPAGVSVADTWWMVPAFQAYAAHTRTPEFRDALGEVLDVARRVRVAVMCSESVWWRCHRRLISDVAVLGHRSVVEHLFANGRVEPHRPAPGARVRDDGLLIWDGSA